MKFPKTIPHDTLLRDADIVEQMYERMMDFDSDKNKSSFESAAAHFNQKYGVVWSDFVIIDPDKKDHGRGI